MNSCVYLWKQNKKPKAMTTTTYKLTQSEINEQMNFVRKYQDLINKEISYKDLCDLRLLKSYTDSLNKHMELVKNPFIEMPCFN